MTRIQRRSKENVNLKFSDIDLQVFDYIEDIYHYEFPLPSTQASITQGKGLVMDNIALRMYGEKNLSPFIMKWFENKSNYTDDYKLSPTAIRYIGDMIYSLYKDKWDKLIEVLNTEYDPIHNYLDEWEDESHVENETNDILDSTRMDTLNTTETTNTTRTDNLLSTQTINESESTTNSQTDGIFGFNSSSSSNADKSDGMGSKTTTGTNTNANTGTQGVSGTVADTGTNTRDTDETRNILGTEDKERSGKHSGNIGNITTQKMIKEEIELRQWNIVHQMIRDVIELTTLPIYLNEWELPEPGTYVPSN